ncbi:MAG TPA: T9SS type A sorting domain-containing protein [Bacteroidia bacterium]|jgi:sugar lactone lactonase YvrE|nr:T9SS type A sorting domain-containing protein [Bacteroidia bacterium]
MKKAYLFLLPVSLFIGTLANAQVGYINTIAGDGIAGFAGDGQPATNAKIDTMGFTAVDDSGNVYIADAQNNRIRKVYAQTGIMATIAGTGVAGWTGDYGSAVFAELYYPFGIAVDHNRNIYFSDNGNGVIRKINQNTGIITTFAGTGNGGSPGNGGPASAATFHDPAGVAVDAAGNVYVSDDVASCVRKINVTDSIITLYAGDTIHGYSGDGGQATAAELNNPLGIAFDNNGNLYICEHAEFTVRKVDASGIISEFAGIPGNNAYTTASGPSATSIPMGSPTGVSCDKLGNVYIADAGNSVIRQINGTNGYDYAIAGSPAIGFSGDGGPAVDAELNYPFTVSVDLNFNLYIGDLLNFRIRKVNGGPTAVPEISAGGSFAIYPNPASSTLNIQFSGTYTNGNNTIAIEDMMGRTVASYEKTVKPNFTFTTDISKLANGMYFIKISNADSYSVLKFIKE